MQDFEKLGVFYLGRPYGLETKKPREGLLLLDSRDLVTHAVCIGMTGSGKTGLCLSLIEEALLAPRARSSGPADAGLGVTRPVNWRRTVRGARAIWGVALTSRGRVRPAGTSPTRRRDGKPALRV